jgi:hypothetical protein
MDPSSSYPNDISRPLLRPLLPSTAPRREALSLPPKRQRVSLACAACRSRKTKVTYTPSSSNQRTSSDQNVQCDGRRPICHECIAQETQCQYTETDTAMRKSRHEALEALFEMLKSFPESEANALLARIRAGATPSLLVEQVTHGTLLMEMHSSNHRSSGCMSSSSTSSL